MQAVINACASGELEAKPALAISNNSDSGALARAKQADIPHIHLSSATHPDPQALDIAIRDALRAHGVELVLLVGYMRKVGPRTLQAFKGRVLNIHPALLPKFGGKGMYGLRIHEAVVASGAPETGVTIHLVDQKYDHGPIVAQCRVPVREGDTPNTLAHRVLEIEHSFLVDTLSKILHGDLALPEP
jgi:phosphoribosylglycinamide formyltransferase-1